MLFPPSRVSFEKWQFPDIMIVAASCVTSCYTPLQFPYTVTISICPYNFHMSLQFPYVIFPYVLQFPHLVTVAVRYVSFHQSWLLFPHTFKQSHFPQNVVHYYQNVTHYSQNTARHSQNAARHSQNVAHRSQNMAISFKQAALCSTRCRWKQTLVTRMEKTTVVFKHRWPRRNLSQDITDWLEAVESTSMTGCLGAVESISMADMEL